MLRFVVNCLESQSQDFESLCYSNPSLRELSLASSVGGNKGWLVTEKGGLERGGYWGGAKGWNVLFCFSSRLPVLA